MLTHTIRWSHPPGNAVVPSPWQATGWNGRYRSACASVDDHVVTPYLPSRA